MLTVLVVPEREDRLNCCPPEDNKIKTTGKTTQLSTLYIELTTRNLLPRENYCELYFYLPDHSQIDYCYSNQPDYKKYKSWLEKNL